MAVVSIWCPTDMNEMVHVTYKGKNLIIWNLAEELPRHWASNTQQEWPQIILQ